MNAFIEYLKDKLGNVILPVTSTKCVLNDDGKNVDDILDEQNKSLSDLAFGENSGTANIWDEEWLSGYYSTSDVFISASDQICSKNLTKVSPNSIYSIKVNNSNIVGAWVCTYDKDKKRLGNFNYSSAFTTDTNTHYIRACFGTSYGSVYNNDIAIIEGTSGSYVPYVMSNKQLGRLNSNLSSLEFNGWTIPDGMPLKDASKVERVDLSTLSWTKSGNRYYATLNEISHKNASDGMDNVALYADKYTKTTVTNTSSVAETIATGRISSTTWGLYVNSANAPSGYAYFELETPKTISHGNEAVSEINESLVEQKLLPEKSVSMRNGYYGSATGVYATSDTAICDTDYCECNVGDLVHVKYSGTLCRSGYPSGYPTVILCFYNSSKSFISSITSTTNEAQGIAPTNAKYYTKSFLSNAPTINISNMAKSYVYINNAIDKIEADLTTFKAKKSEWGTSFSFNHNADEGGLILLFRTAASKPNFALYAFRTDKYILVNSSGSEIPLITSYTRTDEKTDITSSTSCIMTVFAL